MAATKKPKATSREKERSRVTRAKQAAEVTNYGSSKSQVLDPGQENGWRKLSEDDKKRLVASVIREIETPTTLTKALAKHKVTAGQFFYQVQKHRDLAEVYASARQNSAHLLVQQMVDIADDSALDAQQARNRIDVRKWIASRIARTEYGDQIDINVNNSLDTKAILAEARQRRERVINGEAEVVQVLDIKEDEH